MDFADLREKGLGHLEKVAGTTWTDFNAHDPGLTILEHVAYVLSDLMYRSGYTVPELLATDGGHPDRGLISAGEILPCHPVTTADLRALVVDVAGVRNAWVEPATGADAQLHYHPGRREHSLDPDPPASVPVVLQGLFTVLVEAEESAEPSIIRARVAQRLFAHRPMCIDITNVRVLDRQGIQVDATIEIGAVEDPDVVLLDVLQHLSDHIAPAVGFVDTATAARDGVPIEDVYDGPLMEHGYLAPDRRAGTRRRTELRSSDLIHAMMETPGVRGITRLTVAAGGPPEPWAVELDPERTPQLDLNRSRIELTRGGRPVARGIESVRPAFLERRGASSRLASPHWAPGSRQTPTAPRDRSVGRYLSLQHHLPAVYGIAEMGLPDSADPTRRAQAKQLKAYLLILDQLLANMFAQLAHVGDLFSFDTGSDQTYFPGLVDAEDRLALEEIRGSDVAAHAQRVASILDAASADDTSLAGGRRDRFLTHLLARFAEELADASLVAAQHAPDDSGAHGRVTARDKERFLQNYALISSGRGSAADDLAPAGPDNRSGLVERVRLKLGLDAEAGEDLLLVEHLLLRPTDRDEQQGIPLLTESDRRDPYSLQVTFVLPLAGRLAEEDFFQPLVHHTIRSETPAHLVAHVLWLHRDDWETFRGAHAEWRDHRRRHLRAFYGLEQRDDR